MCKFYLILFCFLSFNLSAQSWEKLITDGGSSGNEIVKDMDVDAQGNIYIIGTFSGAVSFGNITLTSNGSNDFFVVKYDTSGNVVYAVNYGSTAADEGNAIAVDNAGNAYITGDYRQFFTLGNTTLTLQGPSDIFTAKLDQNGAVVWAKKAGGIFDVFGQAFSDRGLDIAVDNLGGVYVSGTFSAQQMVFGPFTVFAASGTDFIGKYNSNTGVEQWAVNGQPFSSTSNSALAYAIEYNSITNSIIVAGECKIGLFIGPGGQGRFSTTYIREILPNGTLSWVREIGGSGQNIPQDIHIDNSGSICLSGRFNGTVDFPVGNSVLVSLNGSQNQDLNDAFLLKFNTNASTLIYSKAIIGNQNIEGQAVYTDQNNNIYWGGSMSGAPTLDNIPFPTFGSSDAFLVRLNNVGNVDWIETAGGADEDLITNVIVNSNDKIIVSGGFNSTAKFGNTFVSSQGFSDLFIAQIDCKPNIPPPIAGSSEICIGDTVIYSIPEKFGTNFSWALASGGILDTSGGRIEVVWTTEGSHILSATPSNICGSGETRNLVVLVKDVPSPPLLLADTAICLGIGTYSIANPSASSYQWSISGGGNLVPLNTQALVTWTSPGAYQLQVSGINECGIGPPQNNVINVLQFPSSNLIIGGNTNVCLGQETYTVNREPGTTYNWQLSGGGVLTASDTSASINWTNPGTYILRVTPSNVCGTANTNSIIINVIESPSITSISGDTLVCTGPSSYSLPALNNGLYNWTLSGGGNLINLGNTVVVNWSFPGDYFITANAQNLCGTSLKDTIFVKVRSNTVQPGTINGPINVCFGTSNYSLVAQNGQTYSWSLSSGGTLNFVNNQASVNWTQIGQHTLTVSTANECGQGQSRTLVVDVKNTPTQPGIIFGSDDVCLGLRNYNVFAESGISYTWSISGGGQIFPSGNSVSVNWTIPGTYDLIVTPTNQCGSGTPRVLSVKVKGAPANISGLTGIDSVCLGNQIYTINNPQTGNDIIYNWSLSGGGLIAPNGNTASINWISPGTYTLTVQAQNSCGFGQPFSKFITVRNVNEQFTSITGDDMVCLDTSQYQVTLIGGFSYNWSLSGGGLLNANNNNAEIIWNNTGNYTLSVATSDGCTKSLQVEVKDIPNQPSLISGDTVACFGSRSYAVEAVAGQTYNWSLSSGGGSITSFGNAAIANWNSIGNYDVIVSSTNLCGTGPDRFLDVDVLTVPTAPQYITPDTLVCKNQTIGYVVAVNPFETYTWNLNRAGLISPVNENVSVQWLDTGSAVLSVNASNQCGVGMFSNLDIRINDVPKIPSITGPDKVCLDSVIYITPLKADVTYSWNLSGGGILTSNLNTADINWTNTGIYDLQLSLSNNCGSGPIRTLNIEVFDLPSVPLLTLGDTIVCLGLNAYEVQAKPEESYLWSLSGGGNISSQNNTATVNWTSVGSHDIYIQASNLCGLSAIDTIAVEVRRIPLQPSTIIGDIIVCLDNRVYSVNPVNNVTYNWSINANGNLNAGDSASASVDWLNPGLSIISVSASNLCGTGPSQAKSITISDIPQKPVFSGGDTLTCLGQETYSIVSSAGLTYNWSVNGGGTLSPNLNQATVNWTQTGNWAILASLTNFCGTGPEDTLFTRIKTLPLPLTFINPDTLVCLGNKVYQVSTQPEITYSWSLNGGGSFSSVNNQAFVTWNTPGVYALSVTPVNICGSGNATSSQISVNTIPTTPVFINPDTLSCLGPDTYSVLNQNNAGFLWNVPSGGGSSSNANQLNVNWTSTGTFPIEVSAFNFCGTSPLNILNVDVNQKPAKPLIVSGDSVICLGFETYRAPSTVGINYNWSLSSGGLLSSLGDSAIVNWLVPGNHLLSLTSENYCGLSSVLEKNISLNDIPGRPINLNGNNSICKNDEILYSVQAISGQTYSWSLSNFGSLSSDSNAVRILFSQSGEQILEVSAINNCGESDKTSLIINVRDVPNLQGNILGENKICVGSISEYSVANLSGTVYSWGLKSGGEITAQENTAVVDWGDGGFHVLALNASNSCGVADTLFKEVRVDLNPKKPQIIVRNDTLFSDQTLDNVWYLNGEILENQKGEFIIPELTGRYTLQIINTCSASENADFVSFYGGENLESEVYLIPNPANVSTRLLIPLNLNILSVRIINSEGRKIGTFGEVNSNELQIAVNNLNPGIYVVDILISNGDRIQKKLIVN